MSFMWHKIGTMRLYHPGKASNKQLLEGKREKPCYGKNLKKVIARILRYCKILFYIVPIAVDELYCRNINLKNKEKQK